VVVVVVVVVVEEEEEELIVLLVAKEVLDELVLFVVDNALLVFDVAEVGLRGGAMMSNANNPAARIMITIAMVAKIAVVLANKQNAVFDICKTNITF
jgi:hypothetical protein